MPPPPRPNWADLPPELVSCIAARLKALRCYIAARGVCAAWRSALVPAASPYALRVRRECVRGRVMAASLPLRRSFHLSTIPCYGRCVGSSGGWLAVEHYHPTRGIVLLNPLTGRDLKLVLRSFPPPHRIVFTPNPSEDDFTAVATWVSGPKLLAYVSARGAACPCSFEEITVDTAVVDVVYHAAAAGSGGGKFYCLFKTGEVRVLRVPRGLQTKPALEPLFAGAPSDPAAIFAPPYTELNEHTLDKHLVVCEGDMYQIWRKTGGAMDLQLPGGASLHVSRNEVFVLRYAPARRPCWEAAEDLGGHSVFIEVYAVPSFVGSRCRLVLFGRFKEQLKQTEEFCINNL